jgi:DNA repair exonuclease SbcCD ATPase subunit
MISIAAVEVEGESGAGPFRGAFAFTPGLQVISAPNYFGKSLAAKSIAWCLGLEPLFGSQNNDPSCFPVAVREVVDLGGTHDIPVTSSAATLTLDRDDGRHVRVRRAIKGDPSEVVVEELTEAGKTARTSRLYARKQTMKDEHGGLQRFLFEWIGLPRVQVMTISGEPAELYLENIAPLFFIDQNEGWTDLQSLQVYRYGLQQISEVAVEYLLGATDALAARFARQTAAAREDRLKAQAVALATQVGALFAKQGWTYNWSTHGSVADIVRRWSARTIVGVAKEEFRFDLANEQARLAQRADALREALARGSLDPMSTAAASDASQAAIDLKVRRHSLREELRVVRFQAQEQRELAESLEHRIHSAKDVVRLKRDGIGRLDSVECPTCHRSLDQAAFALTTQSIPQVEAHIDALEHDRSLIRANVASAEEQATRLAAELSRAEEQLRSAERALAVVNAAVGSVREQLAKTATDLASVEREIDKTAALGADLTELQRAIDTWLQEAEATAAPQFPQVDLARRRATFEQSLQVLLRALGHSAVTHGPNRDLRLDDQYVPYLGPRRLRSLGSASDHSRLVAAYVLALAEAARSLGGPHPGFVVLDEPLQQNPDPAHRQLFLTFLESAAARQLRYQTIIFTSLRDDEISRLKQSNVQVVTPEGDHLLRLSSSPAAP